MVTIAEFNFFEWNGKRSVDFGVFILGKNVFSVPARNIEENIVPGRNGSVFVDNGNYLNIPLTFECVMIIEPDRTAAEQMQAFKQWLYKDISKYKPLRSSFYPLHTRMAILNAAIDVTEQDPTEQATEYALFFTVSFSCKPQMYLNSALEPLVTTKNTVTIINNTDNIAEPYIDLRFSTTSAGGIGFKLTLENSYGVQIFALSASQGATHFAFDAEAHEYACDGLKKSLSAVTNAECLYPLLRPGENKITVVSTMEACEFSEMKIIERLWEI